MTQTTKKSPHTNNHNPSMPSPPTNHHKLHPSLHMNQPHKKPITNLADLNPFHLKTYHNTTGNKTTPKPKIHPF